MRVGSSGQRRTAVCGALGLALMLAGCSDGSKRVMFDGNYYPPSSTAESADLRSFSASVTRASSGMPGAQLAVKHEATRYCVQNFGNSDIDWAGVPEGARGPAFARAGDRVSVRGRCMIW